MKAKTQPGYRYVLFNISGPVKEGGGVGSVPESLSLSSSLVGTTASRPCPVLSLGCWPLMRVRSRVAVRSSGGRPRSQNIESSPHEEPEEEVVLLLLLLSLLMSSGLRLLAGPVVQSEADQGLVWPPEARSAQSSVSESAQPANRTQIIILFNHL